MSKFIHQGITAGSVIAAILSNETNHSTLWMVLHFFCGWIYVLYHLVAY